MPLYGLGVYLAESSTKADEYGGLAKDGNFTMLVVRAVGGIHRTVDTHEFDPSDLRRDIFEGRFHSVYGDRVTKLNKPYREFVVYESSQLFPEFIIYYRRSY